MKKVLQTDNTGCGIASVAFLAGKTYNQIKKESIKQKICTPDDYGTSFYDIYKLLTAQNILVVDIQRVNCWLDLKGKIAIVGVHKRKNDSFFRHWVVYKGDKIYDSAPLLKNYPRQDFGRIKPYAFIEINYE